MPTVSELQVKVTADTHEAESGLSSLGSKIGSAGSTLATAFGGAALAGVVALAGGFAASVTAAAGFEQQMSAISAVSGATGAEMAQLSTLALDLGKNTSFSASEAAQGIEELIKAGISVGDVMGGAASASLSLAAAGGIKVGEAAEIAANAMNQFNLKGADLGHVADLIAGAANASAIDVNDFKFSLAAVGAVANTVGFSFDDTATAIAMLGQAGIKGSDAGTSLKTMFMSLQPQTDKQTKLFRELGLITADGANQFFDATGKVRSMADVAGTLQTALSGMTQQQKLATLETIFGSDAIRAAAVFAQEGSEGFNEMAASMSKVTAEAVAAERLNNLAGSWEQLKGSLETLAITLGLVFLPLLKNATDGLTGFVNTMIPIAEQWGPALAAAVTGLIAQFQAWGPTLATVGEAFSNLLALFSGDASIGQIMDLAGVLTSIFGPAMTSMILDFVSIAGDGFREVSTTAIELMGAVVSWFQINWPLIKQVVDQVILGMALLWEQHGANIVRIIGDAWAIVKTTIAGALDIIGSVLRAAMQVITGDFGGAWDTMVGLMERQSDRMGTIFGAALDGLVAILDIATGGMITTIGDWLSDTVAAITDGWQSAVDAVSGAWDAITSTVDGAIDGVTSALDSAWSAIGSAVQGAWDGFTSAIQGALDAIKTAISTVWNQIPEDIRTDLEKIASHLVTSGAEWVSSVTTAGANMLSAITEKLGAMVSAVTTWASEFLAPITGLVGTATSAATEVGGGMLSSLVAKFGEIVSAVGTWVSNFLAPVTSLVGTATSAALSVGGGILTAIQGKLSEVISAVTTWAGSVVSAISGIVGSVGSAAASIGSAIVNGITNAISAGVGAIRDAAYRAARAALDAAKGALGIESPSKVFALEVGRPSVQGIIKGVEDMAGPLGRTMAGLVPVPSVTAGYGSSLAPSLPSYGGSGGGGDTIFIDARGAQVYDGSKFEDLMVRALERAQRGGRIARVTR